ncbi:hypothetical protein [Pseudonocardia endophytica]|uniref:Lipoprotein n=1 Tax=Pseudonocardia endophytica TaxID=401976 RepID=A0A4R1HX53_PSEEN|nr:hypothetical protein [Pseudonocardia endophytica]TCK24629.1 hypothetical protein EV378_0405 [Pseudonocardia endophytica]
MRRASTATAALIAATIAIAGCANGGRSGTDQPGVQGPSSVAPGPAGNTQRTSIATTSIKDLQAALRANDVDDPEHWAQIVTDSRPYPAGPTGEQKLRQVLIQYRATPDDIARITNTLTP